MTSQAVEGTWIRTGGYGRFRGEWDSGKLYVVAVHWRYRNEAKSLMHVQSCYCCCCCCFCCLSLKRALYLNTKVLTEDTILHLLLETRPPFFVIIRDTRRKYLHCSVIVEPSEYWSSPRGSNPRPHALKSKVFLGFAVVVTWSPNLSAHRRIILMKGPFWIRTGLCFIWFHDKCMLFSLCFFTQYTPPDYLPKVYEDLPMSPTHREAVINAFVYVHQTLHQANERLAKRGGRVMAITPRHYLDFINHYVSMPSEFYTIC